MCLLVCLLFIGHTTFVHFAALPPSTPRAAKPSRAAPRGARGQAHAQREHARACRTTSQRKNRCADAFQKQDRTRASVYFSNRTESYLIFGRSRPWSARCTIKVYTVYCRMPQGFFLHLGHMSVRRIIFCFQLRNYSCPLLGSILIELLF